MNGTSSPVISAAPPDSCALADDLQIVHTSYGRLRVHLPRWSGKGGRHITAALRRLPGVTSGEGVLESTLDGYQPVRGAPPTRRRTTADARNRAQYLATLNRQIG